MLVCVHACARVFQVSAVLVDSGSALLWFEIQDKECVPTKPRASVTVQCSAMHWLCQESKWKQSILTHLIQTTAGFPVQFLGCKTGVSIACGYISWTATDNLVGDLEWKGPNCYLWKDDNTPLMQIVDHTNKQATATKTKEEMSEEMGLQLLLLNMATRLDTPCSATTVASWSHCHHSS